MYCEHCGAKIEEGAKFCAGCGKPVAGKAAPAGGAGRGETGGRQAPGQYAAKPAGRAGLNPQEKKLLMAVIAAIVVLAAATALVAVLRSASDTAPQQTAAKTETARQEAEEPEEEPEERETAEREPTKKQASGTAWYTPAEYPFTKVTQGGLSDRQIEHVLDVVVSYTDAYDKSVVSRDEISGMQNDGAMVLQCYLDSYYDDDDGEFGYGVCRIDEMNRWLSFYTSFRYGPNELYDDGDSFTNDTELWIRNGFGWEQDVKMDAVCTKEGEIGVDFHTIEVFGPGTSDTYFHARLLPNDQGKYYLYSIERK